MKIIAFSDTHIHPFEYGSTVLPSGVNSRLQDSINAINQIVDYAITNNIKHVLFGGDLFHVRKSVPTQCLHLAAKVINRFVENQIHLYMISGNHDMADAEGNFSSLTPFLINNEYLHNLDNNEYGNWHYFEEPEVPFALFAIPYTENVFKLKQALTQQVESKFSNKPRIFLGHLGIQGAKVGADFVLNNEGDPTIEDLNTNMFSVGLLGHYHLNQKLGNNFYYIGSHIQHNWGDVGQKRGFVEYDTETNEVVQHLLNSPKFIEVNDVSKLKTKNKGDFVRVNSKEDWSQDQKEYIKEKYNLNHLEIVPVVHEEIKEFGNRLDINLSTSIMDVLYKYVDFKNPESLDKEYLFKIVKEIL